MARVRDTTKRPEWGDCPATITVRVEDVPPPPGSARKPDSPRAASLAGGCPTTVAGKPRFTQLGVPGRTALHLLSCAPTLTGCEGVMRLVLQYRGAEQGLAEAGERSFQIPKQVTHARSNFVWANTLPQMQRCMTAHDLALARVALAWRLSGPHGAPASRRTASLTPSLPLRRRPSTYLPKLAARPN